MRLVRGRRPVFASQKLARQGAPTSSVRRASSPLSPALRAAAVVEPGGAGVRFLFAEGAAQTSSWTELSRTARKMSRMRLSINAVRVECNEDIAGKHPFGSGDASHGPRVGAI
jgi:hypothetical protein